MEQLLTAGYTNIDSSTVANRRAARCNCSDCTLQNPFSLAVYKEKYTLKEQHQLQVKTRTYEDTYHGYCFDAINDSIICIIQQV